MATVGAARSWPSDAPKAKAGNKNIIITCSVNEGSGTTFMPVSEIVQVWNGVKAHIDGVEVHRYTAVADWQAILTGLGA